MTTRAVIHLRLYFFTAWLHFRSSVSSISARTISVLLKIKLAQRKTRVCVWVCVRERACTCERVYACAQLCPTLCEPLDCPGSSVYKIFRARILESVVISYSRVSPTQGLNPHILHLLHWRADSLPLRHLGSLAQSKTCVHVQKHRCQPQERIKYFLLRLTLGERSVNE